ncbi:MAG: hypothetical protein NVS4B5_01570 [Vulcanimicrobiaceae bacterium]
MTDRLPVTVVVPAYNAAATLAQTLESILNQQRAPREIIVLDDGSSDATVSVASAYPVRVISQRNGGLADARNVAIHAAATPWIALLDADDLWAPDRLAAQWALHERSPDELVVTSDYTYLIDDRVVEPAVLATFPQYRSMRKVSLGDGTVRIGRSDLLGAVVRGNFVLPSSLLLDRRLFHDYGEWFSERERLPAAADFFIGEDYEWLLRVLRRTDVLLVERALVDYRRSKTSLSADGGRLRYGDVKLGELVCAAPHRYAVGAAEALAYLRPAQLVDAASRYVAEGDAIRAHAMFVEAARTGNVRARAYATVAAPLRHAAGRWFFRRAFALWRGAIRPIVARLRRATR